eukprot:CAMPEP_0168754652 /NCGR_PEP_ID=MMETSP0724-20121128/19619_1 /TAXON_ID=265536 /ORGANISM="Amphiprora sp., Strain CCMP467" /LENGTH=379 /DNA_ID=CAMNT_0008803153 /DNA_START=177 /DNA_END=1312 /DNA_ORIENTATION=+
MSSSSQQGTTDNNDNSDDDHGEENPESVPLTSDITEEVVEDEEHVPNKDDSTPPDATATATIATTKARKMQALEIDDNDNDEEMNIVDDTASSQGDPAKDALNISADSEDLLSDDDDDDDMEGLLDNNRHDQTKKSTKKGKQRNSKTNTQSQQKQKQQKSSSALCSCCATQKIGNTTVFWPSRYQQTGWGMAGPHHFGPPAVLAILWAASFHFIRHAFYYVGWITGGICIAFSLTATYYLLDTAFRDPGIVAVHDDDGAAFGQRPAPPTRHHRWCDVCQAYQPPTGAHCPHCNVCVEGYDHHCAWMGCCIGKGNHKQFVRFNMTWLLFFCYSIFWVSALGPFLFWHGRHHGNGEEESFLGEEDALQDMSAEEPPGAAGG